MILDRFTKVEAPIYFKNKEEFQALGIRSLRKDLPWHYKPLGLQWDSNGGYGTSIALIDTGVYHLHPCLSGGDLQGHTLNLFGNYTYGEHGTATCSLLLGNGTKGVYGLAPKTTVHSFPVLSPEGQGSADKVVQALRKSRDLGVDVINISLGSKSENRRITREVRNCLKDGILVIAAGGNNGDTGGVMHPARQKGVLSVGSVDRLLSLSPFSSTQDLGDIDVVAPGQNIRVALNSKGVGEVSGTSFAAPIVSGIALRLASMGIKVTPEIITQKAFDLGLPGLDVSTGFGLIDYNAMLKQ